MRIFKQDRSQRRTSLNLTRSNTVTSVPSHHIHPILKLQHAIGNQAVLGLRHANAQDSKLGSNTTATVQCARYSRQIPVYAKAPVSIQTKLTVNAPGDIYEQEADRVADQMMRMPDPQLKCACRCNGGCPECQAEQPGQENEYLHTKRIRESDAGQTVVPPVVYKVLRSSSQSLNPATRAFFEPRFGYDLSRVRVHADAKAAESARAMNALAYTVGPDVVFGTGQYTPETAVGKRLIAHELTHVLQQRVAPSPTQPRAIANRTGKRLHNPIQAIQPIHHTEYRNTIQLYQDCTRHNPSVSNPDNIIRAARAGATPIVSDALSRAERINQGTGNDTETAAFNHIFHNPDSQQRRRICDVYRSISGWLPGLETFICNSLDVCERESEEDRQVTYAYLGQCRGAIVHICPAFFSHLGEHEQALTIIHEGAHRFGVCGRPERYFGGTGFPPANAANVCPDSYAYFVDQVAREQRRRENERLRRLLERQQREGMEPTPAPGTPGYPGHLTGPR